MLFYALFKAWWGLDLKCECLQVVSSVVHLPYSLVMPGTPKKKKSKWKATDSDLKAHEGKKVGWREHILRLRYHLNWPPIKQMSCKTLNVQDVQVLGKEVGTLSWRKLVPSCMLQCGPIKLSVLHPLIWMLLQTFSLQNHLTRIMEALPRYFYPVCSIQY